MSSVPTPVSEVRFTCGFLWMCAGYYRHSEGYTPDWPGMERYQGQIVHPQTWPDDLDYTGKRVLVIGSGATAATLIPAIAGDCEHVTMLQRSPTYFYPRPNVDELADTLRELQIPDEWVHEIIRRRNLRDGQVIHQLSAEHPEMVIEELLNAARGYLGDDFDIDTHFRPKYLPWKQRLAVIPDGDLFKGIASGKVDVVTDHIDTFTEQGVKLVSGIELEADIIITATGFNLNVLGDAEVTIDGDPIDYSERSHLPRRDVLGYPEPGGGVRIPANELDDAGRPDLRLRVPPARAHGRARSVGVHPYDRRRSTATWSSVRSSRPTTSTRDT